jgi:hypothetical protein
MRRIVHSVQENGEAEIEELHDGKSDSTRLRNEEKDGQRD